MNKLDQVLRLYLVTDSQLAFQALCQRVEAAIHGGVTMVQYRDKHKSYKQRLAEALALKDLCDTYGVAFIVNDDVALAIEVHADGVHVGQGDLAAGLARLAIEKDRWLGVSVTTVEEALQAEAEGADYLGVGAVFPTMTKSDAAFVPLEQINAICSAVKIPVVAIGGINQSNVGQLCQRGLKGIAVVSAILGNESPQSAAEALSNVEL